MPRTSNRSISADRNQNLDSVNESAPHLLGSTAASTVSNVSFFMRISLRATLIATQSILDTLKSTASAVIDGGKRILLPIEVSDDRLSAGPPAISDSTNELASSVSHLQNALWFPLANQGQLSVQKSSSLSSPAARFLYNCLTWAEEITLSSLTITSLLTTTTTNIAEEILRIIDGYLRDSFAYWKLEYSVPMKHHVQCTFS